MLTWESSKIVGYEGGVAVELRRGHCLSTDTKPTGPSVGNGSYLREMDTGDEYAYDAQNDIWRAGSGGGGGAGLPTVTNEDNGDVLTVVEGEWAKAAPSGGGGLFIIHANEDEATSITTLDKTWQEIWDAFVGGQVPVIDYIYEDEDSASRAYIGQIWAEDNEWALIAYVPYYSIEPGQELAGLSAEVFTTTSADGYPDTSGSIIEG